MLTFTVYNVTTWDEEENTNWYKVEEWIGFWEQATVVAAGDGTSIRGQYVIWDHVVPMQEKPKTISNPSLRRIWLHHTTHILKSVWPNNCEGQCASTGSNMVSRMWVTISNPNVLSYIRLDILVWQTVGGCLQFQFGCDRVTWIPNVGHERSYKNLDNFDNTLEMWPTLKTLEYQIWANGSPWLLLQVSQVTSLVFYTTIE